MKQRKGLIGKADVLFSAIIRSIGYCEHCGKSSGVQLQCAHIISRGVYPTRVDLRNAFCLCAACHRYFTNHPREFSRFISTTWAQEYYDDVFSKSRSGLKNDWEARITFFKALKKDLESGSTTLAKIRALEI
jgi:hypothetical protein